MVDRGKICGDYVKDLIKKSQMPRNQIAALSGLSNPYIRELEGGRFARVRRERLIALAIALNLGLFVIDDLLSVFDRRPLSTDDIPTFLKVAWERKGSAALIPVKELVALELAMYSAQAKPGDQVVINIYPTIVLTSPGQRRHTEKRLADSHPLFGDLIEAINQERRDIFHKTITDHSFDQYICLDCLRDYVKQAHDEEDRNWRVGHIRNVIQSLRDYEKFNLFLLGTCPTATFTLKMSSEENGDNDKLFLIFWPHHRSWEDIASGLNGFITDNPVFIQNFKEEVELRRSQVMETYLDRQRLIDLLEDLIRL